MLQRRVNNVAWVIGLIGLLFSSASMARPVCSSAASDSDGDGFGWENGDTCVTSAVPVSAGLPICQSALSDPDGDGFGWESNDSCRVAVAPPVNPPGVVPGGTKPFCQSASSDPDGDGFGWENSGSCVVRTLSPNGELPEEKFVLKLPACSDNKYDPDGDGFGWENSSSCTFKTKGDSSLITDVILVTGQSNALGSETIGYDPFDASLDSPVRRVYAYTSNGWGIAGLRQIWDRGWYPRSDIDSDPANNFAFHFGKSLVKKDANAVVGIIMVTLPGAAIRYWDRDTDLWNQIDSKVNAAIDALPGSAKVTGILWHQGETDFYSTDSYSNRLSSLIGDFRAQSWFAADGVFICGETLNSPLNDRLIALNTDGDARTGCVVGHDLGSIGDDVHFNAPSLRTLGDRYADEYQALRR